MNYPHSNENKIDNNNDDTLTSGMDKEHLLEVICHTLTYTDLSTMSDKVNSIDLSNQNLCDDDLQCIIKAMQDNKKSFNGIKSINLSNNFFTDNVVIDALFKLFGEKFQNLQVLILSNCGIKSNLYNDKKLKSLHLSAAITWFTSNNAQNVDSEADSDDTFDFIDDDDDDDDSDDDEGQSQLTTEESNDGDDEKTEFLNISQAQDVTQNDYKSTYLSRAIQSILYYR